MIDLRKGGDLYYDLGPLALLYPFIYLFGPFLDHIIAFNIAAVSLLVAASFLFTSERLLRSPSMPGLSLSVLFIVIVHYLITSLNPNGCSIELKGIFSLGMLGMLLFVVPRSGLHKMVISSSISGTILWMSAFGVLLSASGFSFFSLLTGLEWRSGFYSEPSHLVLFTLPFFAYRLLNGHVSKSILVIIAIYLFYAFSLSLLVALASIFLVKILCTQRAGLNLKMMYYLCLIIVSLMFILPEFDTSYVDDRFFGLIGDSGLVGDQVENLSSIVWLNGWSQGYESMTETLGLGLGFNQMACGRFYSVGMFSDIVSSLLGGDTILNAEDGSFMASKLVAELGVIGIFVVGFVMYRCILIIRRFTRIKRGLLVGDVDLVTLQVSGAISLLIMLFVRNTGYFSLNVILAFSLLFLDYRGWRKVFVSR